MRSATDTAYSTPKLPAPGGRLDLLPLFVRVGSVWSAVAIITYAAIRAHSMLIALQGVPLARMWEGAELVSVGDALVCVVGYKLAVELVRAAIQLRRA